MYDRILVPTDGSELAERAFDHALDLARTYDASVDVVYAVEVATGATDVDVSVVREELERRGSDAADRLAERARDAGVGQVRTAVVHDSPHRAILEYAEDNDVDLVVMGTHGRSGLDRYLLGSVTEKVVRLSDVPVLTVRKSDDE